MTRPIKVGLFLPLAEGMMGGRTPMWGDILSFAERAEELGFDSVWVADHLLMQFTDWPADRRGFWECWSILAALAARTRTVQIGSLVSCVSYRNPALLAKMAVTVDEISGGRLILGLGAGWHEAEYKTFGYSFDDRVSRFEESLFVVKSLIKEGKADFNGVHYRIQDCELRPRGVNGMGLPIMVGSRGHRMLHISLPHVDIWNAGWTRHPSQVRELQTMVNTICVAVGRDPRTVERTAGVLIDLPGQHSERGVDPITDERIAKGPPAAGSLEDLATLLQGYADEDISQVQVWLAPCTIAGVEEFGQVLSILDRRGGV